MVKLDSLASSEIVESKHGSVISFFLPPDTLDDASFFLSLMAARAAASDGDTLLALALTRDVLPLKPGLVSGSLNSSTGEGLVLADLSSDWLD